MTLQFQIPHPKRISTAPAGKGWKRRPEIIANPEYVKKLFEEHRLTERDEALVKFLAKIGILSSRQIKRLIFTDLSTSNMQRRLRELYDYHVLDRTRMLSKEEGITYALGKAGRIWAVGENRMVAPRLDVNLLDHDLGRAEVFTLLVEALRKLDPDGSQHLEWDWWSEDEARVINKNKVVLEPDGLFQVRTLLTQWANFYVEIDRGTERGQAFIEKIKRYEQAYRVGNWQKTFGDFPLVLIVTTSRERASNLAKQIATTKPEGDKANKIIWALAPLSALQADGIFGTDWQLVEKGQIVPGRQRISLNYDPSPDAEE